MDTVTVALVSRGAHSGQRYAYDTVVVRVFNAKRKQTRRAPSPRSRAETQSSGRHHSGNHEDDARKNHPRD